MIPSNSQKKVDILFQRPNYTWEKDDNKDQALLKGEWFKSITTQEGEFEREIEEAEEFTKEEVKGAVDQQEEKWRYKGRVML